MHAQRADRDALAPIERARIQLGVGAAQQRIVAERRQDRTRAQAREPRQRGDVHVVVVVVRDEDGVERRQVAKRDAGRRGALRAQNPERTRPLGPNRIEQKIDALGLNQKAGMADETDPQRAAFDPFGRVVERHRRQIRRPGRPPLRRAHHAPEIGEALVARSARREEAQPVEMV
jgi:hypothetical protein